MLMGTLLDRTGCVVTLVQRDQLTQASLSRMNVWERWRKEKLAEEMGSLCPMLCEVVGLELLVSVVMLQPEGDKANTEEGSGGRIPKNQSSSPDDTGFWFPAYSVPKRMHLCPYLLLHAEAFVVDWWPPPAL